MRWLVAALLAAGLAGCVDQAQVVRERHAWEFRCMPAAVGVQSNGADAQQRYWTAEGCGVGANYVCAGTVCAMEREWRVAPR
jgi:hypothetical protein